MAPGMASPGFGIPLPPLGTSSAKPVVQEVPTSLVPSQDSSPWSPFAAGSIPAASAPAGRCGIFPAALPRAPHSTEARLARPLKGWKILLSAYSSRSVTPQSIQQQPSVVCRLQPHVASAPTRTGRSPSHHGQASPSHPWSPTHARARGHSSPCNAICSIQRRGAKVGCAGKQRWGAVG